MSTIRLKSPTQLTLTLLAFMLVVGMISAALGFTFGSKALKGVTQPAISPVLGRNSGQGGPQQRTTFLSEADVLERVKADMSGSKTGSSAEAVDKSKVNSARSEQRKPEDTTQALPIKGEDKDVIFEVRSSRRLGDQLVLDVALTNNGSEPAQFLYTFLDITDEQGRVLSATTTGLPAELKPNGEPFSGTITIPGISLENAQKLSLKLQDYPNQDIELQVNDIPVVR